MSSDLLENETDLKREIGRYGGDLAGPTLLCVSAIHGNEPAGIAALERVLAELRERRVPLRGEIVALRGNLAALAVGRRYINQDLNRLWTEETMLRLSAGPSAPSPDSEELELLALKAAFNEVFERARGEVVLLDLHTSSADGEPFLFIGDTLRNRRIAFQYPLPVILGLEEQLDGGLTEYLGDQGCLTLGLEAGQHDRPESIDNMEAAVWFALVAAGLVDAASVPALTSHRERLFAASRGLATVLEVRYRYPVEERDRFAMEPGFSNFHAVRKGQLLARDRGSDVLSLENGLVLLPLYQALGDDGFFIARSFRPFWIRISRWLRKLRIDKLAVRLPGIEILSGTDKLRVRQKVARFLVLQIFHLFGFRKLRQEGDGLLLSRRRFDLKPPGRIKLR